MWGFSERKFLKESNFQVIFLVEHVFFVNLYLQYQTKKCVRVFIGNEGMLGQQVQFSLLRCLEIVQQNVNTYHVTT